MTEIFDGHQTPGAMLKVSVLRKLAFWIYMLSAVCVIAGDRELSWVCVRERFEAVCVHQHSWLAGVRYCFDCVHQGLCVTVYLCVQWVSAYTFELDLQPKNKNYLYFYTILNSNHQFTFHDTVSCCYNPPCLCTDDRACFRVHVSQFSHAVCVHAGWD